MKIGVIGTFIRDRIFPFDGDEVESIGGIFFTVSFLANLLDSTAEIYPVALVGEDFFPDLCDQLSAYDNVRLDGLRKADRDNTQVCLTYTSPQERYEVTTEPMPPLEFEALRELQDADAVLVNLITGDDVALPALNKFRSESGSLIYLDFHSKALGIDDQGKRFYRRPDDWRAWIALADVLQLNEMEARTLAQIPVEADAENLIAFGKGIITMAPSVVHLTLAEAGSYLFLQEERQIQVERVPTLRVPKVVDIIGCGDAFSAGYIVHFLANQNVLEATKFANRVAALNCTFIGSSGVKDIRKSLRTNANDN